MKALRCDLANLIKIWYVFVRARDPDYFKKELWDRNGNWQLRARTLLGWDNSSGQPQAPAGIHDSAVPRIDRRHHVLRKYACPTLVHA